MAIKLKRGLEATIPTLREGEPGFTTDSKKLFVGSDAGNIEIGALVEVTWQELKGKRDASLLTPGQQYRITDYVTTTVQADTRSAGHQFDIIVTADDVDKLNENARACLHEGDTYFANSKLEAWKLEYCLDNDTTRFAWADEVNGKGVIYRMIDEFNNDVPYDFKNIQFIRKLTAGVLDLVDGSDTYVYTFNLWDETSILDASNFERTLTESYTKNYCTNNIIKPKYKKFTGGGPADSSVMFDKQYELNNIVLLNRYTNFSGGATGYHIGKSNFFDDNCYSITLGAACNFNKFDKYCFNNILGDSSKYNTFGNNCYSNTFGDYCSSNTFVNNCAYNAFGNDCYYLQISDITGVQKRYISVENGTKGASSANKFDLYDPAISYKDYQVTFKKSASGKYLMLWATDTGTMTGKVKATATTPTWADIV